MLYVILTVQFVVTIVAYPLLTGVLLFDLFGGVAALCPDFECFTSLEIFPILFGIVFDELAIFSANVFPYIGISSISRLSPCVQSLLFYCPIEFVPFQDAITVSRRIFMLLLQYFIVIGVVIGVCVGAAASKALRIYLAFGVAKEFGRGGIQQFAGSALSKISVSNRDVPITHGMAHSTVRLQSAFINVGRGKLGNGFCLMTAGAALHTIVWLVDRLHAILAALFATGSQSVRLIFVLVEGVKRLFDVTANAGFHSASLSLNPVLSVVRTAGLAIFSGINLDHNAKYTLKERVLL